MKQNFLNVLFGSGNQTKRPEIVSGIENEPKSTNFVSLENKPKSTNFVSLEKLSDKQTIATPKAVDVPNPLIANCKVKFTVSKEIKDIKDGLKTWLTAQRSYSGTLRTTYLHFTTDNDFKSLFGQFGNLVVTLNSATNRDSFTNLLDKWLKVNICESLKREIDGVILFGVWDFEKDLQIAFDGNGNPISKVLKVKTNQIDRFGSNVEKTVYKLDEKGNYIPEFNPFDKWSVEKLVNLLIENQNRINSAREKGIDFSFCSVVSVNEPPKAKEPQTVANVG